MSKTNIQIACNTNSRFLPDCAVMLRSLSQHNAQHSMQINLLHDNSLHDDDLASLQQCLLPQHVWNPLRLTPEQTHAFPDARIYGGATACFRLLLPTLLPQHERVLYLDADTMIRGDIQALWETPIANHALAAVTNPLFGHMWSRIQRDFGLNTPDQYFNSGVLLLNLNYLRVRKLDKALLNFAHNPPKPIPWPDQDSLNATLYQHRRPLDPRFNALPGLYFRSSRRLPWTEQQLIEARTAPLVVHFAGPYKPWHYRCRSPFRTEYFNHLAQTPWAGRPIEGKTIINRLLKMLPGLWALRLEEGLQALLTQGRRWRHSWLNKGVT